MALQNTIEAAIRLAGREIEVRIAGNIEGEEGDQNRQPSTKQPIWVAINSLELDTELDVANRVLKATVSGANTYVPALADKLILDSVEYTIVKVIPNIFQTTTVSYDLEARG